MVVFSTTFGLKLRPRLCAFNNYVVSGCCGLGVHFALTRFNPPDHIWKLSSTIQIQHNLENQQLPLRRHFPCLLFYCPYPSRAWTLFFHVPIRKPLCCRAFNACLFTIHSFAPLRPNTHLPSELECSRFRSSRCFSFSSTQSPYSQSWALCLSNRASHTLANSLCT